MHRTTSSSTLLLRSPLGLCALLSVSALGCGSDATDSKVGSAADQGLGKNQVVVTPGAVDATRDAADVLGTGDVADLATGDAVDAGGAQVERTDGGYVVTVPGSPPITVGAGQQGGPTVIGVTRTDLSEGGGDAPSSAGPRIIGVTRTDHAQGTPASGAPDDDGKTVVKQSDGTTTITVPGFPTITLRPVEGGGLEVDMAGTPPFKIPKGTVIEAPGGIRIEG